MNRAERYIIFIALLFLAVALWFYHRSPIPFSLSDVLSIVVPIIVLTGCVILLLRLMGRPPDTGEIIVSRTAVTVFPSEKRRRRVWISAALVRQGEDLVVTTFGKPKARVAIADILSLDRTVVGVIVSLRSGEKWEIAGLEQVNFLQNGRRS